MRNVPEAIKLALADSSLPIKKRILLYRRVWNAEELKYALENNPVDVTDLLVEASSIKMALDTDEVDKWDASNVTLTFNNDLNCFKEGLKGGLFENAVLWGSKLVYSIETSGKNAASAGITVFTGYIYSSPVFRDNGNQIELTATSSLDALEYVSAEDFCLSKTDEPAVVVTSESEKDQGKEFATVETGVGYVDTVKYGTDLESAQTLAAGNDYELSDTNEYAKPAVVKLKFTPTDGYRIWLSYRYWHKDMKIEDVVNALLDLVGVEKREVERAAFAAKSAKEIVPDIPSNNYNLFCSFNDEGVLVPQRPANAATNFPIPMLWCLRIDNYNYVNQTLRLRLPSKGFLGLADPNTPFYCGGTGEKSYSRITFRGEDGAELEIYYFGLRGLTISTTVYLTKDRIKQTIYSGQNVGVVGVDFKGTGLNLLLVNIYGTAWIHNTAVVYKVPLSVKVDTIFKEVTMEVQARTEYMERSICRISWREKNLAEIEYTGKSIQQFFTELFTSQGGILFVECPEMLVQHSLQTSDIGKGFFSYRETVVAGGSATWELWDSADKVLWDKRIIKNNSILNPVQQHLRLWLKITSNPGYITAEQMQLMFNIGNYTIPLINLTDLSVGAAIAQLAKMVSYEIGFNQDGVFFFRSRQGRYAESELTPNVLVEADKHLDDVDSLGNRITVEYGDFKTTVDDFTEGKTRPNSIDTYGVHEKSISGNNFIPPDNVDISGAVAKANYEALSTPGYTLQADCRPDLSLELGDKITICAENTQIADKTWSDYNKFLKLPVWKRVFKIIGLELSFSKRLMTLTLKDVTSAEDVPTMEYNVYQTRFPTPLDYKE